MADLESLTNEELRLRLLECGYANMPVTQTTRKVLIKKLKNHLEGQKAKTKRETIHVMKYSSGEEDEAEQPKKTNRRATLATPAKAPPSPGRGTRRSVDPVVLIEKTLRSNRVTPQKKILVEDDESEEEAKEIRRSERKKSESPALSLSKTVTTTYTNKKTIVEAEDEDDEEENIVLVDQPRRPSPARPGISSGLTKRQTFTSPSSTTYENDNYTSPRFNKPSLSTSYNTYSSPTANRYSSNLAAAAPADSNGTFNMEYESPYLSDFTRRLSKLHAEPLSPQMKPVIPKGTGVYYRTVKNSEVPQNQQSSTLSDHLWEVARSLTALKGTFFIIFIICLVLYLLIVYM